MLHSSAEARITIGFTPEKDLHREQRLSTLLLLKVARQKTRYVSRANSNACNELIPASSKLLLQVAGLGRGAADVHLPTCLV